MAGGLACLFSCIPIIKSPTYEKKCRKMSQTVPFMNITHFFNQRKPKSFTFLFSFTEKETNTAINVASLGSPTTCRLHQSGHHKDYMALTQHNLQHADPLNNHTVSDGMISSITFPTYTNIKGQNDAEASEWPWTILTGLT